MKLLWISIIIFVISACGTQSIEEQTVEPKYASDNFTRTGVISVDELITRYLGFAQEYKKYSVVPQEAKHFSVLKEVEFVVFFGLWCHDSKREVPRLIKLIESAGLSTDRVKLVAIDLEKNIPYKLTSQFSVQFTPTIFVTQDGQVIAKIVEKPKTTLAKDILSQILH